MHYRLKDTGDRSSDSIGKVTPVPGPQDSSRLPVLLTAGVGARVAGDYDIDWNTIDSGGVMRSMGGSFELSGTIGQPDAGPLSGEGLTLTGGFWFGLVTDDCNADGGVNLIDYSDFESCLSGPDGAAWTSSCSCFDIDGDEDVDLADMAEFQRAF